MYIAIAIVVVVLIVAVIVLRRGGPDTIHPEQLPEPKSAATPEKAAEKKPKAKPAKKAKKADKADKADPKTSGAQEKPDEPEGADDHAAEDEPDDEAPELDDDDEDSDDGGAAAPRAKPTSKRASPEDVAALKKGLKRTRGGFISRLANLFGKKGAELDPAVLDEMEALLVGADIGVKTADALLTELRSAVEAGTCTTSDQAWDLLAAKTEAILAAPGAGAIQLKHSPTVILVVGVNGVGKTTTIGKLAADYVDNGKRVLLAAGDTFRAAAVMQLGVWARRTKCDMVKGKDRADPSSVIFDAIKKGIDEKYDVVICDTAGRLHTKTPLMEEIKKVGRTVEKVLGRDADEILLVLDATTGQNAIQQAELFKQALPINGIALTKLDGSAKGGVILGIVDQHGLPVRYVGIGERVNDLRPFDPAGFVEALFERPEPSDMEDDDSAGDEAGADAS